MFQCSKHKPRANALGHSNLGHWAFPFDMAQGGELVEPFWISPAFAEAATRRQVLRISNFQLLCKLQRSYNLRV